MAADFGFIPGYLAALRGSPAALEARGNLDRAVGAGRFSERIRAQIALAVAQESHCDYCIWARTNIARQAGLSWEDVALARAGTAIDRREAAILKFACQIAHAGRFSPDEARALARDPSLGRADMLEVIANAALAVLENFIIQSLAPASVAANDARRTA